jgi:hypothetical protein
MEYQKILNTQLWHRLALPGEAEHLRLTFRATIAIHASIMLWVGSWDIIAVEKRREHVTDDDALFRSSLATYLIYTFLGTFICILTDTLYSNAGLDAGFLPPRFSKPYGMYCFRLVLSWVGTMLMWAGLYNLIDLHAIPTSLRVNYRVEVDLTLFFGGVVLLILTDSFYWCVPVFCPFPYLSVPLSVSSLACPFTNLSTALPHFPLPVIFLTPCVPTLVPVLSGLSPSHDRVCYLDPEGTVYEYFPTYTSPLRVQLRCTVRVLVSVLGQTMIGLGVYDFLENNNDVMGASTRARELLYGVSGALLLVWTGAWIPLSWMDLDEEALVACDRPDTPPTADDSASCETSTAVYTVLFDVRSFLALVGQMVHNTAVWSFLDLQIYPGQTLRHVVYIVVGGLGLLYTGTLGTNFGMLVLPLTTARRPGSAPARQPSERTALLGIGETVNS